MSERAMTESAHAFDEELVRRVRAGDEAAARVLFERHLPALRARARSRLPASLKGRVGESDVIQEAYLSAFLAIGEFEDRGDGSFAAWLRQILERRIANEVRDGVAAAKRDARREVRIPTGTGGAGPARDQFSPSEEAMGEEEAARLRAARATLSEDHRTVIALVHDEGLTLVAAGERMGRSGDAARKLYSRAMAELAARLRPPPGSGA
jgi:RNA polymerase sigma-70 factor (ECF subfamily)